MPIIITVRNVWNLSLLIQHYYYHCAYCYYSYYCEREVFDIFVRDSQNIIEITKKDPRNFVK